MACSSSTMSSQPRRYHVFLSFRGSDTRDGFTSHLYKALCGKHIDAYIDEKLRGGDKIEPTLLERIEESYISVVIFSAKYADSTFCLRELSKILECKETKGQVVIPVFYQVDPSHVQELIGSFGKELAEHKRHCKSEEVKSWGHALKEIANLKGWDSNVTKPETVLLEKIVDDILKTLELLMPLSDPKGLVGIDSRAEKVELLLKIGSLFVGIVGMGGIGKSTIADVVSARISGQFEGQCFLPNIRKELENCTLDRLRNKILSQLFGGKDFDMLTLNRLPSEIRRMLSSKKFLLVLDDVDDSVDLKALVGEDGLFGRGSRIIVTSRDKQVLRSVGGEIYEVESLADHEALQLFTAHAFRKNHPTEDHKRLSKLMAGYAQGHPLALKVLGSNLCDRGIQDWKSEKEKLEEIGALDKRIQKCLITSFEGLDQTEKNIFLDIACFFRTCDKNRIQELLKLCKFHPTTGISRLSDKCFLNVSKNQIWMHDFLQQLGQDIVYQASINDPGKRSRLWSHDDIVNVLTHNQGTQTVETISLDMSKITEEMELRPTVFQKMYNLRFLDFYNPETEPNFSYYREEIASKIRFPRGLEFLPNTLALLCWDQYPLKSLPSKFYPKNLVELRLTHSQLTKVWKKAFPYLEQLKIMDLSNSRSLIRIPDFSEVPNLEDLNLSGCISLDAIPSSIDECCSKLATLNLSNCVKLRSFPSCLHLTSLNILSLARSRISEFPKLPCNIKQLNLDDTQITWVPSSIGDLSQLFSLSMSYCDHLKGLPSDIGRLKCLKSLDFSGCSNLANLPDSICDLNSLESLSMSDCYRLEGLPINIGRLKCLKSLDLSRCGELADLPNSICDLDSLEHLNLFDCRKMNRLPMNLGKLKNLSFLGKSLGSLALPPLTEPWGCLTSLYLPRCGITEIPTSLAFWVSLKVLNLSNNDFESIPPSIKELSKLTDLILSGCERLRFLPEIPSSLKRLDVSCCTSLKSVPSNFLQIQNEYEAASENFNFVQCVSLEKIGSNIEILDQSCSRIERLATSLFDQGYDSPIRARFCVPGSEVPTWFSHQNTQGSSLAQFKPECFGGQLLGCAFCVVLANTPHQFQRHSACWGSTSDDDAWVIACECRFITESGSEDIRCSQEVHSDRQSSRKSEHILVWYDSNFTSDYCVSEASFQSMQNLLEDSVDRFAR